MLLLRKILFPIFVTAYLVFCPLLIAYALGYLFRPGAPQEIVKTGLIHLSSVPPGARVVVGRSRFRENTPTVIRDLLPGHYRVRVVRPGYQPWQHGVRVEAGKASSFGRILLLPVRWRPEAFPETRFLRGIRGSTPDAEGERFLVWEKRRLGMLTTASAEEPRGILWFFERGRDLQQAFWVLEESRVLFRDGDRLFLIPASGLEEPALVLKVRRGTSVSYSEETGQLYYVDAATGRFSSIPLVPLKSP